MCVSLPPGDLNPDPCPPHSTSIYTCEVTTAPRCAVSMYYLCINEYGRVG